MDILYVLTPSLVAPTSLYMVLRDGDPQPRWVERPRSGRETESTMTFGRMVLGIEIDTNILSLNLFLSYFTSASILV